MDQTIFNTIKTPRREQQSSGDSVESLLKNDSFYFFPDSIVNRSRCEKRSRGVRQIVFRSRVLKPACNEMNRRRLFLPPSFLILLPLFLPPPFGESAIRAIVVLLFHFVARIGYFACVNAFKNVCVFRGNKLEASLSNLTQTCHRLYPYHVFYWLPFYHILPRRHVQHTCHKKR